MSLDGEPISKPIRTIVASTAANQRRAPARIAFDRRELDTILNIYGRMVAAGEWRDYAIDHLKDVAVFSIFRNASEAPLFRVEKRPSLARRQGAYAVVSQSGQVLRRGHELTQCLKVLEAKTLKVLNGGRG